MIKEKLQNINQAIKRILKIKVQTFAQGWEIAEFEKCLEKVTIQIKSERILKKMAFTQLFHKKKIL